MASDAEPYILILGYEKIGTMTACYLCFLHRETSAKNSGSHGQRRLDHGPNAQSWTSLEFMV